MKGMVMRAILLLNILFFGGIPLPVYGKENYENLSVVTKLVKGKITSISYVNSKITVSSVGEDGKEKEITFVITEKTKILRSHILRSYSKKTGDVNVSLSGLMQGDEVIVEYYDNPKVSGPQAAKSIELVH